MKAYGWLLAAGLAVLPCTAGAQAVINVRSPGAEKDAACAQVGLDRISNSLSGG